VSGRARKISPPSGFDPRTVQPVASRYTDHAIRPYTSFRYLDTVLSKSVSVHTQILSIQESVTVTWQCYKHVTLYSLLGVAEIHSLVGLYISKSRAEKPTLHFPMRVEELGGGGGAGQQFASCRVSAVIDLLPTPFPCFPQTSCLKYRRELHLCCIITQEWKNTIQIGYYYTR